MFINRMRIWAAIGACLVASAPSAQEVSDNRVAAKTAWSVFVEDSPNECWGVTTPTETVNTKDGRIVAVNRDETVLMVFYRPDIAKAAQVAFTGGYPFASGSAVNLNISGNQFEMFTDGEWAWPANPSEDAKIVAAMKRGAEAVLTGLSGRGTTTKDSFSLLGFTAAIEEAEKRCTK